MSFMSLRESLARSKDKWKKQFRINHPSLTSSTAQNLPAVPTRTSNDFTPPSEHTGVTPSISAQRRSSDHLVEPTVTTNKRPENNKGAWSGVKSLLENLESSANAFGPLKSAIGGLNRCIDIYESVSKGRKDYDELRDKLAGLLDDLAGHMASPVGLVMTNSVKRLASDLEAEVRNVEERQARNTRRRLVDAIENSDEVLICYRRICGYLERLTLNANLSILKAVNEQTTEARLGGISPASSAVYNSAESDDIGRGDCTPGTREPQINFLLEWARYPEAGRTCWMNGMAGTGKTTIAHSVCSRLDETYELGASFFCSRTIPESRQIKHIIPSIAYQLARFSLPFRSALVKALESDPDAHTRALKIQYQKLIVDPLLEVQQALPTDFIVVIDALDECENESTVGQLLDLLLLPEPTLPIRFLVSSRPEMEIVRRMASRVKEQGDVRLVLHDLDADSVKVDIEVYMRYQLKHIPLTDAQWSGLIDRCGVLFIYASTTCRYIEQAYNMETTDEAVNTIIGSTFSFTEDEDKSVIDELYLTIIAAAFNQSGMGRANKSRMRDALETVLCAIEPVTLNVLAGLLELGSAKQVDALLRPLRSVLNVTETTGLVTTLHASLPDFMFSPNRSQAFCCSPDIRHTTLAKVCLRLIDTVEPKFNICALPSSYFFDDEMDDLSERVGRAVSPGLNYACRSWAAHLHLSKNRDELVDIVRSFFLARLLLWMEILNLTQYMRIGTSIMRNAEKWSSEVNAPEDVVDLAHDAWQFVSVYANHPVSRSTPHIYVSILPFWPRSRPISRAYMPRTVGLLHPTGTALSRRQLASVATWGIPGEPLMSATLSTDGTQIVATTMYTMQIFDASTGDSILSVTDDFAGYITRAAVSPDGMHLVFGTSHRDIYRWSIRDENAPDLLEQNFDPDSSIAFSPDGSCFAYGTNHKKLSVYAFQGKERSAGFLMGYASTIQSIAFSPNGLYIATGSTDWRVRIWTKGNRATERHFKGHTNKILSVCFSPNASLLASGSEDQTVRVWDLNTGKTILGPLKGHSEPVSAVAFAAGSALIAAGSQDGSLQVYNAQTGQMIFGPLEGHISPVHSVFFSLDSAWLFSCSWDGTLRKWNMRDSGVPANPPPTLSSPINIVQYSHDGLRVASGSANGLVHIWDVRTGEMVIGPLDGYIRAVSALDFSPDGVLLAVVSRDGSLGIWDFQNESVVHGPLGGQNTSINCARFSPDGSIIVSGWADKAVRLWDVKSGLPTIKDFEGHSSSVCSVDFSPDGSHVASGSEDSTIRVWNSKTGETILGPLRANSKVQSVEFSSDGLRLLSGSALAVVQIWDTQTGQDLLVCNLSNYYDSLYLPSNVAFSPDGLLIAVGAYLHTISILDAHNGDMLLGPLERHTPSAISVQFSPDGSHVVSCSVDHTIRFWDVSSCRTIPYVDNELDDTNRDEEGGSDHVDDTPDIWALNTDGWVFDPQEQPIVWIPADLRAYLILPPNDFIISDRGSFKLNFDEANIGEEWSGCYQP